MAVREVDVVNNRNSIAALHWWGCLANQKASCSMKHLQLGDDIYRHMVENGLNKEYPAGHDSWCVIFSKQSVNKK
jgi:hypothetical protein